MGVEVLSALVVFIGHVGTVVARVWEVVVRLASLYPADDSNCMQ